MTIKQWLTKYVYMRLIVKGKTKKWNFYAVFAISCFWHGFYPSYYHFFLFLSINIFFAGEIKHYYSYYFRWIPHNFQRLIVLVFYLWWNSYFGPPFRMFHLKDIISYFNCQYWYGHIFIITLFTLLMSPIGSKLKTHASKMKKKLKQEKNLDKKNK